MSSVGGLEGTNLAHGLARDLDRAHDLGLGLNIGRDRELAFSLNLARAAALNLDLGLARTRALDRAFDLAFNLDLGLARALARTRFPNPDLLPALERKLAHARKVAYRLSIDRVFTQGPGWDPARIRALARVWIRDRALPLELARALDRARELAATTAGVLSAQLGIAPPEGLTDALLNGALDDFSQADLSQVDLARIGLVGVHWSVSGTRWPPGLDVDALIQQSEETAPGSGIYVITRRGETEMASVEFFV